MNHLITKNFPNAISVSSRRRQKVLRNAKVLVLAWVAGRRLPAGSGTAGIGNFTVADFDVFESRI